MKTIEAKDGKIVILIKVAKSWNPPCVKNKKQRIFYIKRDVVESYGI